MLNCNGVVVSSLKQLEVDLINSLHTAFSIHEKIRLNKNRLLFFEEHYFRIIASLRRYRFSIPMNYTMIFFQEELQKLIKSQKKVSENSLLTLQFFKSKKTTQFIISIKITEPLKFSRDSYTIDLYKEAIIASGDLSNLSPTNWGIRIMSKRYSEENGLEDVLLLNEKKNLVECLGGNIYLLQKDQLLTPSLGSGCQDFTIRNAFNQWIHKNQTTYSLVETDLNPFELQKSEEVMILSLEKGVRSVSNYRKTSYLQKRSEVIFNAFRNNSFN